MKMLIFKSFLYIKNSFFHLHVANTSSPIVICVLSHIEVHISVTTYKSVRTYTTLWIPANIFNNTLNALKFFLNYTFSMLKNKDNTFPISKELESLQPQYISFTQFSHLYPVSQPLLQFSSLRTCVLMDSDTKACHLCYFCDICHYTLIQIVKFNYFLLYYFGLTVFPWSSIFSVIKWTD